MAGEVTHHMSLRNHTERYNMKRNCSQSQLPINLNTLAGSRDGAGQTHEKERGEAEKGKVLTSAEATMQVRPVNRGCDTGHCVISTMSEGRLSGHSEVTSDKPACTDLDPEEDEKEDSKI